MQGFQSKDGEYVGSGQKKATTKGVALYAWSADPSRREWTVSFAQAGRGGAKEALLEDK